MIAPDYLPELSEKIAEEFVYNPDSIVANLYAQGKLEEFLEITGLKYLKNAIIETPKIVAKKFVVIGEKCGKHANDYKNLISSMGLPLESAELYLEYDDSKKHNFEKYRNNPSYGAIFFGAIPHKNKDNDGYKNIITKMKREPGYPKIYLLGDGNHLKLTIHSLQYAIAQALSEGAL